jgi:hypothetical protein
MLLLLLLSLLQLLLLSSLLQLLLLLSLLQLLLLLSLLQLLLLSTLQLLLLSPLQLLPLLQLLLLSRLQLLRLLIRRLLFFLRLLLTLLLFVPLLPAVQLVSRHQMHSFSPGERLGGADVSQHRVRLHRLLEDSLLLLQDQTVQEHLATLRPQQAGNDGLFALLLLPAGRIPGPQAV